MIKKTLFKDKKVAIIGISVEGYSTACYLLKHNIPITIFEQKKIDQLGKPYQELLSLGASFQTGENYLASLSDYDVIFRTPGMSLRNQLLEEARKRGSTITSQTKFFFDHCPCKIIGVTGTKGKGTTSTLIEQILKNANYDVKLGGNIGLPPLTFLDDLYKSSWVVLELSSFQLEDLHKSPHIAVVLMVTQEHLASSSFENPNYHPTLRQYIESKANIVRYQAEDDVVIANVDYPISKDIAGKSLAKKLYFSRKKKVLGAYLDNLDIIINVDGAGKKLCDTQRAKLLGKHNRENMMAAALAGLSAGVPKSIISTVLLNFPGLEYRLEVVKKVRGVLFINDSFATTPETTIAAIHSFDRPIILIVGGSEKGSDYKELGKTIAASRVRAVILIGKTAPKIKSEIENFGYSGIVLPGGLSMKSIVSNAYKLARKGDVVLLSPGCASFDMFKNYKERGISFKYEVYNLEE